MVFELNEAEARAHPKPYQSVELDVEFRSPHQRTFLLPAFWDGGLRLVVRFAPTEAGSWDYRVTSNIERWNGQQGQVAATESDSPGFVRTANVHHWATENGQPHLWMGDAMDRLMDLDRAQFEHEVDVRAQQRFTHIRTIVEEKPTLDPPDVARLDELDRRIRYMNSKEITVDLVAPVLPSAWQDRQRYVRNLVARYSAMNITWLMLAGFEGIKDAKATLKEVGAQLHQMDPYHHPRSSRAGVTSGPLGGDGWMDFLFYRSANIQLGSVEHQLYQRPAINAAVVRDENEVRHAAWNAVMNGQYPSLERTGGAGGPAMKVWFDFFAGTRYWELEPYFEVDGGRAAALEGVEYVVYLEKPGPVAIDIEKHGYDVEWLNPINGETVKEKDFKGERYTGSPPDTAHDWVLHISREGHKRGMLKSYKFESRPVPVQVVEQSLEKIPFDVVQPAGTELSLSKTVQFAVKLKRETAATRSMMYLWTGEVPTDGQGYRVLGTGSQGTFRVPPEIAPHPPSVLSLRVSALNAHGKAYIVDKVFQLVP